MYFVSIPSGDTHTPSVAGGTAAPCDFYSLVSVLTALENQQSRKNKHFIWLILVMGIILIYGNIYYSSLIREQHPYDYAFH